jgi:starch-binding outer membrane protein, SusD/RagB family
MMMYNNNITDRFLQKATLLLFFFCFILFISCDEFLDTMPDNRTTLNTPKKITQLLVSAYPAANYSVIAELSSDNIVDNNSPEVSTTNKLASRDRMHDEIFAWEPVISSSDDDSPFFIWEECYKAIATANHALQAINVLEKEDNTLDMSAQRGEALLCRAFGHFILVNIFSQAFKDEQTSRNDLGIPYITDPETKVKVDYDRGSVAEVYSSIKKDIEEGINLIDDDNYQVPKYHFNTMAANAFAARFYLYIRDYEKVVFHANRVLGSNPTPVLRNWTGIFNNSDEEIYAYINSNEPANLLILPTYSTFFRMFIRTRYAFNGSAQAFIRSGGPAWSGWPSHFAGGNWWWTYGQEFGSFNSKVMELFEYTDKIAGIGYTHVVRTEFTTDETLLCRAEAFLMLGRKQDAISDLNTWCISHQMTRELTEDNIKSFYTPDRQYIVKPLNSSKMSSSFLINTDQEPIMQCILHFRRIETIFEGLRWFDIKRFGIEIKHMIGRDKVEVLTWDDPRRAIQLPQDVIAVGMESNPVKTKPLGNEKVQPVIRWYDDEME